MSAKNKRQERSTADVGAQFEVVSQAEPIPLETVLQSFARLLLDLAEKQMAIAQGKSVE
jgi:hypothetical protein